MTETRQLYASFDPARYHREYYSEVDPEVQFFLQQLHQTFAEGLTDCPGREVLDIGCGPTITAVLSASRWADTITMADLVPANREAVMEWLKEWEDQLDWSPHLKYVAALEGGGVTPSQLADRIRRKVNRVLPADVLQEEPLGAAVPNRHVVMQSV
ncbi:Phenylethanolamine N-methyltransferase [Amphibalanus amphitrite]|uniref:Phenylethanolamine N-methyltransferase n=1 Tax=Amphibalanus amphitrite TaxID=1232801 RepID=A0A6A4VC11_AMPAM|nr:Phenylethanolamine N-methyltransferase [Amphibalanus amphitrite]